MFDRIRSLWTRNARNRSASAAARRANASVSVRSFRNPVRRWSLPAWLAARRAVRAGVSLADFLRARLDHYMRRAPSFQHPLPEIVSVSDDGAVTSVRNGSVDARAGVLAGPAAAAVGTARTPDEINVAVLRAQREAEVKAIDDRLGSLDEEQRRLETLLSGAAAEAEDLRGRLAAGVADGSMAPDDLRPLRAQRPSVASPLGVVACAAGVAGLALIEAAAFAPGYLDQVGVDISKLDLAWSMNRMGLIGGVLFAVGATAAIFWLYARTLDGIRSAVAGWSATPRLRPVLLLRAVGAALGAALLLAISHEMGSLRKVTADGSAALGGAMSGAEAGPAFSSVLFAALTVAVPLAAALLHDRLRRMARARRMQLADRERFERRLQEQVAARARAEQLLAAAEARRDELMELVAVAREARLAFADEAQAEEHQVRLQIDAERQYGVAFCNGLRAALSADRLAYLAAAAGASRPGGGAPRGASRGGQAAAVAVVAVLASLSAGCGGSASAMLAPVHQSVVVAGPDAPAHEQELLALHDAWISEAVDRPGSTFSAWIVDGATGRLRAHLEVPARWGAGVQRAKAAFIDRSRRQLRESSPQEALPVPPVREGAHRIAVLSAGRPPAEWAWTDEAAADPLHVAVACDASGSTVGSACDAAGLALAHESWLRDSRGVAGSTFLVVLVARSRDGVAVLRDVTVPAGTPGQRMTFALASRPAVLDSLDGVAAAGSALAEAIDVAADELKHRAGRRRLCALTDGRQLTPGAWDFERGVPEPERFVAWLRLHELAPDLSGFESVELTGLHHESSPGRSGFSAVSAARLERLWEASFRELGAASVTLRGRLRVSPLAAP